jgi:hypothetical protein
VKCSYCGGKLPAIAVKHHDDFCTRVCCERFHGLPVAGDDAGENISAGHLARRAQWSYSMADGLQDPAGETMDEARRRDREARKRLGLEAA